MLHARVGLGRISALAPCQDVSGFCQRTHPDSEHPNYFSFASLVRSEIRSRDVSFGEVSGLAANARLLKVTVAGWVGRWYRSEGTHNAGTQRRSRPRMQ